MLSQLRRAARLPQPTLNSIIEDIIYDLDCIRCVSGCGLKVNFHAPNIASHVRSYLSKRGLYRKLLRTIPIRKALIIERGVLEFIFIVIRQSDF